MLVHPMLLSMFQIPSSPFPRKARKHAKAHHISSKNQLFQLILPMLFLSLWLTMRYAFSIPVLYSRLTRLTAKLSAVVQPMVQTKTQP